MMAVEGEMRSCRGRAARLCVWTGILTWVDAPGLLGERAVWRFSVPAAAAADGAEKFSSRTPSLSLCDYRHSLDWTKVCVGIQQNRVGEGPQLKHPIGAGRSERNLDPSSSCRLVLHLCLDAFCFL